jgi:hypothetical protein
MNHRLEVPTLFAGSVTLGSSYGSGTDKRVEISVQIIKGKMRWNYRVCKHHSNRIIYLGKNLKRAIKVYNELP